MIEPATEATAWLQWIVLLLSAFASGMVGGGGLLWFYLRRRIDHRLNVKLETFRHELNSASQAAGFDYQRRLSDFNLFIERKHQVIAELHVRLMDAMSRSIRVSKGMYDRWQLESLNRVDALSFMKERDGIGEGKRAQILKYWDSDRPAAIKELYSVLDTFAAEEARRAQVRANNYRLDHELFLTDEIAILAKELCDRILLLTRYAVPFGEPPVAAALPEAEDAQRVFIQLRALLRREMMRSEIDTDGSADEPPGAPR